MADPVEMVEAALKGRGFKKKNGAWQRPMSGVTHLAGITRSRFGRISYLDVGLVLDELPGSGPPTPGSGWHINTRADGLVDHRQDALNLLNAEVDMPNDERRAAIEKWIGDVEATFFARFPDSESALAYGREEYDPKLPSILPFRRFAASKATG